MEETSRYARAADAGPEVVPLLITSLAARVGYLTLTPSMAWIGSDAALVAFATATVLEVAAYYVPWLDNLLDTIATPAAITGGVITTAAVTSELSPLLRWLAIVAGGGTAGLVHVGTAFLRLKSSTLTAGAGNPLVAMGELVGSVALSLLGLLAPLVAAVVVVALLVVLARGAGRLLRERRRVRPTSPMPPGSG